MIMGIGHSQAFHIDATGEDQTENVGSREGVWWLPNSTANDYLVVTNQGQNSLQANLSVFDAAGKPSTQIISLAPRAMARYSIRQIVAAAGLTGSYGGIKVSAASHAGSLDTLHVVFDPSGGFSVVMKMFFYDPRTKLQERDYAGTGIWTIRAPMLALSNPDPSLAFPVGTTLHPQLFIHNNIARTAKLNLSFHWHSDSADGQVPATAFQLAPFQTQLIDISSLQSCKAIPADAHWASVSLTTDGLPDEVVAVAASYDDSLHYGAQTPFSDQLAVQWEGGMWRYDPQHDSIITTGNGSTKPTQAAFTIFHNQGTQKYELDQTLQPGQQMWMDIGKLIREGVPDKNGNTLPADLSSGSYKIRDLSGNRIGTLFEGKVVYDKTYGHVTYGCAACCGWGIPYLWYNPIDVLIEAEQEDGVWASYPCESEIDDVSTTFYNTWVSDSTPVVTVDYYGTHTGVSVGSTDSYCEALLASNDAPEKCPALYRNPSGGANTINISQSPATLNMSSGDTSKGITVSVSPSSFASSVAFTNGSITNYNSASTATFAYNKPGTFTGNDLWTISVGGTNSPSGDQSAQACVSGACASQLTTTNVPPQVLIQVLYGGAHGQAASGDTVSEPAIGSSIKDRFGRSEFPGGSVSQYQGVIISSQYNGIYTSITTGIEPELDVAISLFNSTQSDTVAGSPCFFTPTANDWTAVENAYLSGTTTVPALTTDPGCYAHSTPGSQIVIKDSEPDNVNGNGAPAFLFERQKSSNSDPAVVAVS